jgi:hypothetical protein
MTCRKALKWWETKVENCEVTPQALWPTSKLLMKRDKAKAVHGHLGLTYQLNDKANVTANCLENQFTFHDLCDKYHE